MSASKGLRQQFADTLLEVGRKNNKFVVMVGDISHGILKPFAKENPDRYYNVGICEPTIVSMAAGLSQAGLYPVVHTIAPFLIERSYEQIKLDFGYQKLSATLVSVGGSFDYSQLGCSHHCYTDVSLMSHLYRANVVVPGTAAEFDILFQQAFLTDSINYFRLPDNPHGVKISDDLISLGKAVKINHGEDVTLVTMGSHLATTIDAAAELAGQGISAEILYYPTLKPFDRDSLAESVKKTRKILTIEELSAHDGIFNQALQSCREIPDVRYQQIAVEDFVHGYGNFEFMCEQVGLTIENIVCKARSLMALQ